MSEPKKTPLSQRLEDQLCFDLYATSRAITAAYRPLLQALGLTYPQYLVMLVLWEFGPLTVTALGTRLSLDSGTLSPLLKRLEVAGYLQRRRQQADERAVEVSLTLKGAALRAQAANVPETVSCMVGLEPEAMRELQRTLRAITARLEQAQQGQ
ncbi:MarR family winged helix-turn-helix transcriptional regulator [Deinococcus navajonensis]|uniref:MarR family winged helix-turn-helix transcriptional regulator n=1 Tax=Deinococcus navajonensis TaxID=309884 RepID=A0ABV8XSJ3_9DEIO